MRGRVGRGDPDFGSDSFLDIIANLVGILVILIVLAGLRAAQVSEELDSAEIAAGSQKIPSVTGPATPVGRAALPKAESQPAPESFAGSERVSTSKDSDSRRSEPVVILGPDAVPVELAQSQLQKLRGTVSSLKARLAGVPVDDALADLKGVQTQLAEVASQLPGLQQRLAQEDAIRRRYQIAAADSDAEYQALRKQLVDVNQMFEELTTAERPVEELELRINPVGRRSNGTELLFRIENGQVVVLPAAELFGKAERQTGTMTVLTQTSDIASGTVGPVGGVALDYESRVVAAMVPTSSGASAYMLQKLLRGTLRVTRLAPAEPWKTSIREQGIVSRTMLSAPRDGFARLFVTTDSFEAGRRVAAFIRTLGHGVATQPIELGSDIKLSYGVGSDAIVQ